MRSPGYLRQVIHPSHEAMSHPTRDDPRNIKQGAVVRLCNSEYPRRLSPSRPRRRDVSVSAWYLSTKVYDTKNRGFPYCIQTMGILRFPFRCSRLSQLRANQPASQRRSLSIIRFGQTLRRSECSTVQRLLPGGFPARQRSETVISCKCRCRCRASNSFPRPSIDRKTKYVTYYPRDRAGLDGTCR
ncbi:hypothetical protein DL95DRAFT_393486 [Leptodontidium sp. 2 PMI_412]|nr:hypothetical protein DL95DRAFT_393486 [Leptodontidium sp. 2 PMI_412]